MYFLKEEIGTIAYPVDTAAAYARLLSKLGELRLSVENADAGKGQIVVRCLIQLLNVGIWRCWADRLVFQLNKVDANATSISVSAIPSLTRIKAKPDETTIELDRLMEKLRA